MCENARPVIFNSLKRCSLSIQKRNVWLETAPAVYLPTTVTFLCYRKCCLLIVVKIPEYALWCASSLRHATRDHSMKACDLLPSLYFTAGWLKAHLRFPYKWLDRDKLMWSRDSGTRGSHVATLFVNANSSSGNHLAATKCTTFIQTINSYNGGNNHLQSISQYVLQTCSAQMPCHS